MADERLTNFGLNVRVLREQRQLTLEKLARLANVDAGALGLIERGQRDTRVTTAFKIAAGLKVPVAHLFAERK